MTQYVLITEGVVMQRQPYMQDGFIEAPDDVACGMLYDGEAFSNPTPPPSIPASLKAEVWLTNIYIEDGYVAGIDTDSGMAMAFYIDVDKILVLFTEPAANTQYGWNISSTSGTARMTERTVDGFVLTVADAVEPFVLSAQIYRLI